MARTNLNWIPVHLIQFVLTNRLVNAFKIYLILKIHSCGYVRNDKRLIQWLAEITTFNPKTLRKHLGKLDELNWIGITEKVIYIRSIRKIETERQKFSTCREVEFHLDWVVFFKDYLAATFISHLAFAQKAKRIAETIHNSGGKKGLPYQRVAVSASFPVSHKSIEKILMVSQTKAHELKRSAIQSGLIVIKNDFEKTDLSIERFLFLRKQNREFGSLRRSGNSVLICRPDQVTPILKFKSGKKKKYKRRD